MKLKLEKQEDFIMLSVSEEVLHNHIAVLRAGISKLLQSGVKNILLDLTKAQADQKILKEIPALEKYTETFKGKLAIFSSVPGVGNIKKREEAVKYFIKEITTLLATEAALSLKNEKLIKQKTELEKKIASSKTVGVDPKMLRRENSLLKKRAHELEIQIQKLLKQRIENKPPITVTLKAETIMKTIIAVFEQEDILSVK